MSLAARRSPQRLPAAALPSSLGELSIPVKGLWCLGDAQVLAHASERFVAIVGTRTASAYGERAAARLAGAAARAGLVVVSGLARGIDAAAHRAAIEAGGRTVAVLGTGVDVPYPAGHRTLHEIVQENGAVVSEMEPGRTAFPGCFPRRNRIIAGLSRMTVVVEAGFKSGAINTANWALELGRTVGAVPGQIDDPRAAGSNQLMRDGAHVIAGVDDLLMVFGLSTIDEHISPTAEFGASGAGNRGSALDPADRAILLTLGPRPLPTHEIAFATSLSVRQVSEGLLRLELAGLVRGEGGGYTLAQPSLEVRATASQAGV